ncbi:MAG: DUF2339 domain-containing protein, partial [Hyphomicrobiaceae bacterium]
MLYLTGLLSLLFSLGVLFGIPILLLRSIRQHQRMSEIEHQLRRLSERFEIVEQTAGRLVDQPDELGANNADQPQTDQLHQQRDDSDQPIPGNTEASAGEPAVEPAPEQDTAQPQVTPATHDGDAPPGASLPPADGGEPPAPPPSTPPESIEERLGTKWAVYLGGAAITFGGIFLVRHAIEVGLLGPTARVVLGALLGLILIGLGTRMRFRDVDVVYGAIGGAHVPSVLTSAGTVVLFASAYAAYGLYGLIGPGTAFLLLGLIGLGTLAAALLHGPALAGLGLAGAQLTPALVAASS